MQIESRETISKKETSKKKVEKSIRFGQINSLILAERIRKKDVSRYTYKPTTQNVSFFNVRIRFRFNI